MRRGRTKNARPDSPWGASSRRFYGVEPEAASWQIWDGADFRISVLTPATPENWLPLIEAPEREKTPKNFSVDFDGLASTMIGCCTCRRLSPDTAMSVYVSI